jgi:alpha-beta hydrolase superfamily lysophospholipase
MQHRTESLARKGRLAIHYHRWTPARPAGRRLLVVHGLGDHGGRYRHLAEAAGRRGWEVLAPDLRGHGRSGGQRGHVRRFRDYLDDLEAIVRQHDGEDLPLAVFGHSMGGLVATHLVARRHRHADKGLASAAALALSSPLFGIAQPVAWPWRALGRVLNPTLPRASFANGLNESDATRDAAMVAERRADALAHNRVTARWYCEVTSAIEAVHAAAAQIKVPLLVLQAGDDRMVCAQASRRFFDQAGSGDKSYRLYEGHYHELLREITRAEIVDELLDWLDRRVPGSGPGASATDAAREELQLEST